MSREISSILPYYGAKRQLADKIVEYIGDHKSYLSPFCGSLAIEFAKKPCRMQIVNDMHGRLTNLVRVVQDDTLSVALFNRLYRTPFSEVAYQFAIDYLRSEQARDDLVIGPSLTHAVAYFIASWQGRNGFVGTNRELSTGFCKRFTSKGGDPAVRFRNAVENIPYWWELIRGFTILSECGIGLCERFEDSEGAVIYADPPYFEKDAEYAVDFTEQDHIRLAAALHRFTKARVVLSYYEHPLLNQLYPTWRKINLSVNKNLSVASAGKVKAPEALLLNW